MSGIELLILQFYSITLICVLVALLVTPLAIWIDELEEKQKESIKNCEQIKQLEVKNMEKKKIINGVEVKENPYSFYIKLQEKARKKAIALNEQAKLDFQKWLDSERKETDMSGAEPWCYFCKYRKENVTCGCDPEIRSKEAMCVEAYHDMQKKLEK